MDDKTTDVDGAYLPLLRKKCTAGVGGVLVLGGDVSASGLREVSYRPITYHRWRVGEPLVLRRRTTSGRRVKHYCFGLGAIVL